jgi:glutathione S-transferase
MQLYFSPASPFVRKVRIVARETDLASRIEELDVAVSPVNANVDVSRKNPLGKIPVLVLADGSALFDSPVICEYLDSLHHGRKLLPPEGPARWRNLRQQAIADGMMDAAVLMRYEAAMRPEPYRWAGWLAGQKAKVIAGLETLEHEIDELSGEFTLGPIAVVSALGYLDFRFPELNWRNDHSRLASWFEALSQRPSVKATVPPM